MPTKIVTQGMILDAMIDKMIAEKGENISEEERERLKDQLGERLETAMVMALPDAKMMQLDRMLDGEVDDAAMDKFFAEAGVDFSPVIEAEAEKFRQEFLNGELMAANVNEGGQA